MSAPTPKVTSKALNKYRQRYHTNIEDSWFGIGKHWDLNIYLSPNEVLCATLYPVLDGQTITKQGYPLVVDPSVKKIKWMELPSD